jgi:site-specific DNA-methyltransferase (adenine-specific)/site-specific DNA-methyltransferase (cytosine-N4-specific)
MSVRILIGDCREKLRELPDASMNCCITSPPYWGGLRDYGDDRQIGMEREPFRYAAYLVNVLREVRRVLRDDGSLWLNIADSYAASGKGGGGNRGDRECWSTIAGRTGFRMPPQGYKPKDLVLISFMVAEALRQDGWFLRKTIIWQKPAAIEPTRLDRPSLSHEYIFLLSKSRHYAVRDPGEAWWAHSVWEFRSEGCDGHPAAFPAELVRRCLLCASQEGGTVIDPFFGAGTTGLVADRLGRNCIGIELNPEYAEIARKRLLNDSTLFADISVEHSAPATVAA